MSDDFRRRGRHGTATAPDDDQPRSQQQPPRRRRGSRVSVQPTFGTATKGRADVVDYDNEDGDIDIFGAAHDNLNTDHGRRRRRHEQQQSEKSWNEGGEERGRRSRRQGWNWRDGRQQDQPREGRNSFDDWETCDDQDSSGDDNTSSATSGVNNMMMARHRIARLQEELRDVKRMNKRYLAEIRDLSARLEDAVAQKHAATSSSNSTSLAQSSSRAVLQRELVNAQKRVDMYRKANEVLRRQVNESLDPERVQSMTNAVHQTQVAASDAVCENKTLRKQVRRLQQQLEIVQCDVDAAPDSAQSLQSQLQAYKRKVQDLKSDKIAHQRREKNRQVYVEKLRDELRALKAAPRQRARKADAVRAEADELQQEVADLRHRIAQLSKRRMAEKKQFERSQARLNSRIQALSDANAAMSHQQGTVPERTSVAAVQRHHHRISVSSSSSSSFVPTSANHTRIASSPVLSASGHNSLLGGQPGGLLRHAGGGVLAAGEGTGRQLSPSYAVGKPRVHVVPHHVHKSSRYNNAAEDDAEGGSGLIFATPALAAGKSGESFVLKRSIADGGGHVMALLNPGTNR